MSLFGVAFTFHGTGAQDLEQKSIVALYAIVAAHREHEKREPEDILRLPAGRVKVRGIAKSTFHRALATN
jgi:hypothetical protein